MDENSIQRLVSLVNQKNSFSVALPARPSLDAVAAASSLYLGLLKLGKNVSLSSSATGIDQYDLIGVDKIANAITSDGENLVVSFPYEEGAIDKVTYTIDDERFNLVIAPKEGFDRLDPQRVQYSYSGGSVDGIIVLDSPTLEALGELYTTNQESFKGIDIVNIDRHMNNANYGTINILSQKTSSLSEVIFHVLESLGVQFDGDIATNLYAGLSAATANFSSFTVTADTFELASKLLKAGAVKKAPVREPFAQVPPAHGRPFAPDTRPQARPAGFMQQPQPQHGGQPQGSTPAWFDMLSEDDQDIDVPVATVQNQAVSQQQTGLPSNPRPQPQPQIKTQPKEKAAQKPQEIEGKESKGEEEANPSDWLKPKIFKGGGLV